MARDEPQNTVECVVHRCERVADEYMTLSVGELRLVYAVCAEHSCDRRRGALGAAPEHVNRGLVGLRISD